MNDDIDNYEDIILLPHHVSKVHPQMTRAARAAQFSPFAVLNGHEATTGEERRSTENFHPLDYDSLQELDRRMAILCEYQHQHPAVTIRHFKPDKKKKGGCYIHTTGSIKTIDCHHQRLLLENHPWIDFRHIAGIQGELFDDL